MDADRTEPFITGDTNRFAMLLFLLSEAAFFAILIIAYVYFHSAVKAGPDAANSLDPMKSGIYTVFLLASSFTVWRAEKCVTAGERKRSISKLAASHDSSGRGFSLWAGARIHPLVPCQRDGQQEHFWQRVFYPDRFPRSLHVVFSG